MSKPRVTLIAYSFAQPEGAVRAFTPIAAALEAAWRQCGPLPARIIVNDACEAVEAFCARHPETAFIRAPGLTPGSLFSMSRDMNANLASYFETDYALIVQNDGYPLRPGLDAFLDRWDYIGAPYTRPFLPTRLLERFERGFAVGNGGFSLRSRALCEAANRLWRNRFHTWRESRWLADDVYHCLTLRLLDRTFRRTFTLPTRTEALTFSYDALTGQPPPAEQPFGFHGMKALSALRAQF